MVNMPIFTKFSCEKYALFPGEPEGTGIHRSIPDGVTLIAGINGLGKTTLLTVFLRLLTGPFDISGLGLPQQIDSTLPENPTRLRPEALRFFGQRVADTAKDATATLQVKFGPKTVEIPRSLQNLALISFTIGKSDALKDDAEAGFQSSLCELMNLSSFVDVLLVLHHMVFFPERRPGALWDINAQRHLMRALFLPKKKAAEVAALERRVGSADSNARTMQNVLGLQEKKLREAEELHAVAPDVRASLKSNQALLDADLQRREELESTRDEIETQRRSAKLDFERAKIELEDAERAVERIKFTALNRMFPSMPDADRLTIVNLLSTGECLVCGADSEQAKKELEAMLSHNRCPICGTQQSKSTKVVSTRQVEVARLRKAQSRVASARTEETGQSERLEDLSAKYDATIIALKDISDRIDEVQLTVRGLVAELPTPSHEIEGLRIYIARLEKDVKEAKARRAEAAAALRKVLMSVNATIVQKSRLLAGHFARYSKALLQEEAVLARVDGEAGIAQSGEQFRVPLFRADMTAAARPGLTRRSTAQDVSESQRELMDLAFRFALTGVSASEHDTHFVM